MARPLALATSYAASIARLGAGMRVAGLGKRPEQPLELYEFEACPHCRKAREALSILDLDARIFPCPRGGTRYRRVVQERGGKLRFPYLVDPNNRRTMYESADIVRYLATEYGDGKVPISLAFGPLTTLSSGLATAVRPTSGRAAVASRAPAQPLELWSFEASPYCRLVRDALCALELPYLLHNVAKGSPKRDAFVALSGKMQVPYLRDPNTGVAMFESAAIVRYLEQTYAI